MIVMRRTIVLSFLFTLLTAATVAAQRGDSDFRSIVPRDWKLLPGEGKWHERRFVSASGNAWLSLYATPAAGESVRARIAQLASPGEQITYQRIGSSWGVVSGYTGNRIFYRKAMLACGNRKWHYLAFEYPAVEKLAFDFFVTRASYALKAYERVGCNSA